MEIKTKMKIDSIFSWFKNLQGEKPLTKDEAYNLSKYGHNMTEDDLVKEIISNINSLIKYKASIQSYSVSIDTNHDGCHIYVLCENEKGEEFASAVWGD